MSNEQSVFEQLNEKYGVTEQRTGNFSWTICGERLRVFYNKQRDEYNIVLYSNTIYEYRYIREEQHVMSDITSFMYQQNMNLNNIVRQTNDCMDKLLGYHLN